MKKILVILFLLSGLLYANLVNDGIQAYKSGNYKKAAKLFKKAANQGNAEAQYKLGDMYNEGKGVKKDYQKAVYWYKKAAKLFKKAANQGNADAQCKLGDMYYYGKGVKKDYQKAVYWYKKAANQGNAGAQFTLGVMYGQGKVVRQDMSLAKEYFGKMCDGNSKFKSYGCTLYRKLNNQGY
jgi:TPR repeat protein